MKIYARQIAPEYQESPLFYEDMFPDNMIVSGNRHYKEHTTPTFDQINRYFDEMAGAWEDANFYYQYSGNGKYTKIKKKPDCTIAELLRDYGFTREDGKSWNNHQKHEWRLLLEGTAGADEDDTILACLHLMTGKEWRQRQISGCCQSDWNYIYFPVDEWSAEAIEAFEAEYFNTGSEWIVDDGNFDPEEDSPAIISGCSVYCTSWNDEGIKKEIADSMGEEAAEVVLFAFEGYSHTPEYRKVV